MSNTDNEQSRNLYGTSKNAQNRQPSNSKNTESTVKNASLIVYQASQEA